MPLQRGFLLMILLVGALLAGNAWAEPVAEPPPGLKEIVPPTLGSPKEEDAIPEIFPQVASEAVATEPSAEVFIPPATSSIHEQAATHPQAHEATPLLPSSLTSGWMLMGIASSPKPIPFLNNPGYRATYQLPGKDGQPQEFLVDIILVASEPEAIGCFDLLARTDPLATTTETLQMAGLKKIAFRKGAVDSPAASAQAAPIETIRIAAWFPPFLVLFEGQNVAIGADEVKNILSSLAWRE